MALDQKQLAILMQRVQQGDARAFREFYAITAPVVLAILLKIFKARDRAEDVMQDCYLRAWKSAGGYSEHRGPVIAWLTTLVRNRAIDVIRQEQGGPQVTGWDENLCTQLADPAPQIEETLAISQEFEQISASLTRLSAGERRSIELIYLGGFSVPEVAKQLSVPLGTAKSWVRRGLLKLRAPAAASAAPRTADRPSLPAIAA